jgi:hypothetical protein
MAMIVSLSAEVPYRGLPLHGRFKPDIEHHSPCFTRRTGVGLMLPSLNRESSVVRGHLLDDLDEGTTVQVAAFLVGAGRGHPRLQV